MSVIGKHILWNVCVSWILLWLGRVKVMWKHILFNFLCISMNGTLFSEKAKNSCWTYLVGLSLYSLSLNRCPTNNPQFWKKEMDWSTERHAVSRWITGPAVFMSWAWAATCKECWSTCPWLLLRIRPVITCHWMTWNRIKLHYFTLY